MDTILFCTSHFQKAGSHKGTRYNKWVNYYLPRLESLGASRMFLIDDGSHAVDLSVDYDLFLPDQLPSTLPKTVNCLHFPDNLGRASVLNFPGWWRSFTFSIILARHYKAQKIIHIESDFFIVSDALLQYLRQKNTGWTALYSKYYDFPETAIQIITADAYESLMDIHLQAKRQGFLFQREAELILPFTHVEKSFRGDRLGEIEILEHWVENNPLGGQLDYIGQLSMSSDLQEYRAFFDF